MRILAAVVLVGLFPIAGVRAQSFYGADATERLAARFSRCESRPDIEWDEYDEALPDRALFVREEGDRVLIRDDRMGNGVDGFGSQDIALWHVPRRGSTGCALEGALHTEGLDGQVSWQVEFTPADLSTANPAIAQRLLSGTSGRAVVADPTSPRFGAQLLILRAGARANPMGPGDGFRVVGPLYSESEPAVGVPRGSPEAYWSSEQLASIGLGRPPMIIMRIDAPRRVRSLGRYEVWEAPMRGRNGGVLVALYDRTSRTHRWVFESRVAALGTLIRWLGVSRGFLFGEYASQHGGYPYSDTGGLVAIELETGQVNRIDIDGVFENGEVVLSRSTDEDSAPSIVSLEGDTLRVRHNDAVIAEIPTGEIQTRFSRHPYICFPEL